MKPTAAPRLRFVGWLTFVLASCVGPISDLPNHDSLEDRPIDQGPEVPSAEDGAGGGSPPGDMAGGSGDAGLPSPADPDAGDGDAGAQADAGGEDAGGEDAGNEDAGDGDAGAQPDAGGEDAGGGDAGGEDAGPATGPDASQ